MSDSDTAQRDGLAAPILLPLRSGDVFPNLGQNTRCVCGVNSQLGVRFYNVNLAKVSIMMNGLKTVRERAGLTQAAAAALMGLSKSGYTKIEDGQRKLSDRHIRNAMKAFNANEAEILGTARAMRAQAPTPPRNLELSPQQARDFARACAMFLQENSDRTLATQWLEALIEVVQSHEGDGEDAENLALLRAKVRTVANLARVGLLNGNPQNS